MHLNNIEIYEQIFSTRRKIITHFSTSAELLTLNAIILLLTHKNVIRMNNKKLLLSTLLSHYNNRIHKHDRIISDIPNVITN